MDKNKKDNLDNKWNAIVLRALKEDTFKEIISMYLAQTHEQLSQLKSAIAERKFKTIGVIAHQIKGSSANLGAAQLSDACSYLEESAHAKNLNETIEFLLFT